MQQSADQPKQSFNEIDLLYLNHQSQHLLQSTARKIPFLGFFITLNIAFYAGLFALAPDDLWKISELRVILLVLLILINVACYLIFWREHAIDILIRDGFYKFISANLQHPAIQAYDRYVEAGDQPNKGKTWKILNAILSVFSAVPIAFLLILLARLVYAPLALMSIIFSAITLVIAGIFYFKIP